MMTDEKITQAKALDALFYQLVDDAIKSAHLWNERMDDFSRRTHIRTVFALVEGVIQLMKRSALLKNDLLQESVFTFEEIVLLREVQPFLKDNGEVILQKTKIPMLTNLRFATKAYAKVKDIEYSIDLTTSGWENFKNAIKVRNRITHPSSTSDLEVTIDDMKLVESGIAFFREATIPLIGN